MGGIAVRENGDLVAARDGQTGHSFPPGSLTRERFFPELFLRVMLLTQRWQPVGLSDSSTDFKR